MATFTSSSPRSRASSSARLEARIPREFKKTIEQAAAVTGHPTVTSFVLFVLQTNARKILEDHQQAKLSADASADFVKRLLAPPAPNAALRKAFSRHRAATT